MIQAAHFDIKTVTGLRQALVLSAEYENEPFPLQDYTLHGSIGTYPRQDLKCSVDENGRARIEWIHDLGRAGKVEIVFERRPAMIIIDLFDILIFSILVVLLVILIIQYIIHKIKK